MARVLWSEAVLPLALTHRLRPRRRRLLGEDAVATRVGCVGVAVTAVTGRSGRVQVAGGICAARTDGRDVIEVGESARVVRADGATALVVREVAGA